MPAREPSPPPRRGPGRPAGEGRPDARDALLEAAGRLVARHGAGEVSLRRIAEEAGVTPAMVHYYFGDKEGLFDAMLERTFTRVLARVREVVGRRSEDAQPSPGAGLAELLEVLTSTFAADPWVPTLVVREVLVEGGRFREHFIENYASRIAELLPALMQREIDAGRFREDLDPRLAFVSFMGMCVFPFAARPVIARVLGIEYDEAFLEAFAEHTRRLFVEGARS